MSDVKYENLVKAFILNKDHGISFLSFDLDFKIPEAEITSAVGVLPKGADCTCHDLLGVIRFTKSRNLIFVVNKPKYVAPAQVLRDEIKERFNVPILFLLVGEAANLMVNYTCG